MIVKIKPHVRELEDIIKQNDKRNYIVYAQNSNHALAWKMDRSTLCVITHLSLNFIVINEESRMKESC